MAQTMCSQSCQSTPSTVELARSPLFKPASPSLDIAARTKLTYLRAKAFSTAYGMTLEDVLKLTPKFWKLHADPLLVLDGGALTMLSIQYNLFVGTVAPFALSRPELQPVLQQAMNFDVSAQFMLTEVGHGLDARNLETTATLLPNGDFELHSPSFAAAKCMPPTTTRGGIPVIAVVIARLIVDNEDHGVRPFLVSLGNGKEMCKGVTSKVLPPRPGAHPVDHALTYFNKVRLPRSALLGSLEKVTHERDHFISTIQRVAVGTLCVSAVCIPVLKLAAFNASQFSLRRMVMGYGGKPVPVITFRTQQLPILHAIAQYHVLEAYLVYSTTIFKDKKVDPRVRHAIATAFKAVAVQHFQKSIKAINDGCGWHGFYEHNQLVQLELEVRGVATVEGDIRVLAIRLASELLIGRYQIPPPQDPDSHVARHEAGLLAEGRTLLNKAGGNHRAENFNRNMLPLSLPLVQAVGHRLAYEAAKEAKIDANLLSLYESCVVKEDSAWYAEQGGISRKAQQEMEAQAADALFPFLMELVQETGIQHYSNAPMASDRAWDEFVSELETFCGEASVDIVSK